MKFLIDECLSPTLVEIGINAGFECTHANYRDLRGAGDPEIFNAAIAGDWTLVTNNAKDFRPDDPASPGKKPLYVGISVHAGLICLNIPDMPEKMPGGHGALVHERYFNAAIDNLPNRPPDLINKILEVDPSNPNATDPLGGNVKIKIYDFPEPA